MAFPITKLFGNIRAVSHYLTTVPETQFPIRSHMLGFFSAKILKENLFSLGLRFFFLKSMNKKGKICKTTHKLT